MNIYLIILLILLPVAVGFLVIWLSFKNINKKYRLLFVKLADTARAKPKQIAQIIDAEPTKSENIINTLCNIKEVLNVEIIKAGKLLTKLHLHTILENETEKTTFYVELSKKETWVLSELCQLKNS